MNSNFYADLHCHTNCSDGTNTPSEVLHLAKKIGLQGLSITDHDTIFAYTSDLFDLAKKLQIHLLTGVEISSEFNELTVHILGYGFDLKNSSFNSFLCLLQDRREARNQSILKKLSENGMPISEKELKEFAKQRIIGRPHIAQLMVKKRYVASFRGAFERYLKEGALCYASGVKFSSKRVIAEIQKAYGKAILAHPHFYKNDHFLKELLQLPFDGYECYYSKVDKVLEEKWLHLTQKRGVIATGGSDFHGSIKPHVSLGCSWVDKSTFERLRDKSFK